MADAFDQGQDLLIGLETALRQSCLVVIDDFTELLSPESGLPPQDFIVFLTQLARRPATSGRLLLVTDTQLSLAKDMNLTIIRLGPPAEADAVRLLGKMLEMSRHENEISTSQRLDVVRWLGCNPRALQALVACLDEDSLDDLIKDEGENWDLKDEVFSPTLIQELERRFRARTLSRLSPAGSLLLQFLSIYRRPFTKKGTDSFATRVSDIEYTRRELVQRFLLDHVDTLFFLNPISRELALARLREDPNRTRDAHSLAANYYTRHFRAKGPIDLNAHKVEFVEARYHLTNSDRTEEFAAIASRFRGYLLGNVRRLKTRPRNVAEKNQLIATLSTALSEDQRGYAEPRHLLARLLLEGSPSLADKIRALRQVTLACRESSDPGVWVLRVRLSAQLETLGTTLAIVRQAEPVLSGGGMTQVYYAAAKALAEDDVRAPEVITLLDDAMNRQGSDPEGWILFQLGAAVLARLRRYNDAITLLRDYLSTGVDIPFRGRLFEQMMLLAYATQDRRKLSDLRPLVYNERGSSWTLFNCLCALLDDDFEAASKAVAEGNANAVAATMQAAFVELCRGYPRKALKYLSSVPQQHYAGSNYWLSSLVALSLGDLEVARAGLKAYLDRELHDDESLTFATWISAWDETAGSLESNASFYFPRLPSKLTGLERDIIRLQDDNNVVDSTLLARLPDRPRDLAHDAQEAGSEDVEDQASDSLSEATVNAAPTLINVVHVSQEGTHMGDKNIVGQAAAVGSHASASNVTLQQLTGFTKMDMPALAEELERLRIALREQPTSDENDEALAEISRAARAASEGDEAKVVSHLRASGQWALRAANTIGVTLAAAAISKALGL